MTFSVDIDIDTRGLDKFSGAFEKGIHRETEEMGLACVRAAMATPGHRYETGAMWGGYAIKGSWPFSLDTYQEAVMTARMRRPGVEVNPKVEMGKRSGIWITVYNVVHYFIYHEKGTVKMSPLPMLTPAFEIVMTQYLRRLRRMVLRLMRR